MNFMSVDVNDERAAKGFTCPTIAVVPDIESTVESCLLCDSPRTLGIDRKWKPKGNAILPFQQESLLGKRDRTL